MEHEKEYLFSWAAAPLEVRTSQPNGQTWIKFMDKDKKNLGNIHFRYYADISEPAYFKQIFPCELESEFKETEKNLIPTTRHKRWSFERLPNNQGNGLGGLNVRCNDILISTYRVPNDFPMMNSNLCPAFFIGDVHFIAFIEQTGLPDGKEEYFKDNGRS